MEFDIGGGGILNDNVVITAIVCISVLGLVLGIVGIFAILAYLKDRAALKLKTSVKDVIKNEVAIDVENKNSKK